MLLLFQDDNAANVFRRKTKIAGNNGRDGFSLSCSLLHCPSMPSVYLIFFLDARFE